MPRRTKVASVAVAAIAGSALSIAPAVAKAPPVPKHAKLAIVGGLKFTPGKSVADNQRYQRRLTVVRSGGTLTLTNKAKTEDPHTFSLVKKSQLPTSFDCAVCNELFAAHGSDGQSEPTTPDVEVGAAGLDQPGDSHLVAPGAKVTWDVSAAKGTTLYYLCAIHPWMQGRIKVK